VNLIDALAQKGRIDSRWGLPLPPDRGRDNFPVTAAWVCELGTEADRHYLRPHFKAYMEAARTSQPGVYHRERGVESFNSVDNYIGIVYLSSRLNLNYDVEIYRHGENYGWVFDNIVPTRGFTEELVKDKAREWFGRMIGFPVFVKAGAGFGLSWSDQWKFGQAVESNFGREGTALYNPDITDVGNFGLQLFQNRVVSGYLPRVWSVWWSKGMARRYGDLAGMLQYYDKPAEESPLVAAAMGRGF
jgi:hypothetical protein